MDQIIVIGIVISDVGEDAYQLVNPFGISLFWRI